MQQPMIRRQPTRQSKRNVEAILARQQARQTRDYTTFAPGFAHGNFNFDEIYQLDLGHWFEQCVFVNKLISVSGRVLGYSVARIHEGFITVEHHLVEDVRVAKAWLAQHTQDARTLVELQTTTYKGVSSALMDAQGGSQTQGYIPMRCDMHHLLSMEHEHLRVTRDHGTYSVHELEPVSVVCMLQNNVLSLMGLCCRLLLTSSQNEDDTLDF